MTETKNSTLFDRVRWLGSEIVLGSLIAILSVFTGVASFQGSMSDSDQNKYQNEGMQTLTDANAEYLTANQYIVYDYTLFDSWYVTEDEAKAEYYKGSFSESLTTAITTNEEDPFSEQYYTDMYAEANAMFDTAGEKFELAEKFNGRGDALQLVMLITAIGLAFAAWASLLDEESNMRLLFALLALVTTVIGVVAYLQVPAVIVPV
jgi:hypothetical protein